MNRGGNVKYAPYVFTEFGTVVLANVFNSPTAVQSGIQVVRAFIRLREMLATHKDLAAKLDKLEKRYDEQFRVVFDAMRKLMAPSAPQSKRRIGFVAGGKR